MVENTSNTDFSIHTDSTAITNAEEALESYMHSKILGDDNLKAKLEIYKKIAAEEFDDTILFKHSARKKSIGMSASTTSLSSSSSDEKECKIVTPAIMNLSSVGILPDLRSPDTILNDIKEKESILANILNIDNVKINMEDLEKKEEPFAEAPQAPIWCQSSNSKKEIKETKQKEKPISTPSVIKTSKVGSSSNFAHREQELEMNNTLPNTNNTPGNYFQVLHEANVNNN